MQESDNTELASAGIDGFTQKLESERSLDSSYLDTDDQLIQHTESGIRTQVFACPVDHSGTTVYVKGWLCDRDNSIPILILHDFGEDLSFYRKAAGNFIREGFDVYCVDLPGHGLSGKMLGHIESLSATAKDILQVAAWIKHKSEGKVPTIIGQGFGSLLAMTFQIQYPNFCDRVVLCAPTFRLREKIPRWKRFLIRRFGTLLPEAKLPLSVTPRFAVRVGYGKGGVQSEQKQKLPMRISGSFAKEIMRAIDWSPSRFLKLNTRCLILCAENDELVNYKILNGLLKRHKKPDLFESKSIEGSGHNILTESEATLATAVKEIVEWLKK